MLEYAEVAKENRTGFTRYSQGTSAQALNQTATGVNLITNRADSRIELIARVFAETGFRDLFTRILKLVSQYQDQASMARVNGQWVNFDPRAWRTQFDFSVAVGIGTGNKDQQVQHLMMLGQVMQQAAQIGLCGPREFYNAARKLTESLGFKEPDLFFTDPANSPPKPPPPNPLMLKLQADQQEAAGKLALEREKAQMEHQLQRERLEAEIALKREELTLKFQFQREAELYSRLYAQSEAMVDDGRTEHNAAAGAAPGGIGPGGDGQPGLPGGVFQPQGGPDAGLGIQPGA